MLGAANRRSLEGDVNRLGDIDAAVGGWSSGVAWLATKAATATLAAEHLLKDILKIARIDLLAAAPPCSRGRARAGASGATEPIIGGAFFGVGQNFIRFLYGREFLLGVRFGTHVRVIGPREFAIGRPDFVVGG